MAAERFIPDLNSPLARPRGRPKKGDAPRNLALWEPPPGEMPFRLPGPCATKHEPKVVAANYDETDVVYRCARAGCTHRWRVLSRRRLP